MNDHHEDQSDTATSSSEVETDTLKHKTQWAVTADGKTFWATAPSVPEISAGVYTCSEEYDKGPTLNLIETKTDELLSPNGSFAHTIKDEINKFCKLKEEFHKYGFIHKRGMLLYGPPGTGKTSSIQLAIADIVKNGGIGIIANSNPYITVSCIKMLRKIEPDRLLIVVMEDLDALLQSKDCESQWLSLLDGELQIENVVFIATTNYIKTIDKRFRNRPSRFDMVIKIPVPTAYERAYYLMNKHDFSWDELKVWVEKTDKMAISHIRELIIGCKVFGKPLDQVIEQLTVMQKDQYDEDEGGDKPKVGIHTQSDDVSIDWDKIKKEFDKKPLQS